MKSFRILRALLLPLCLLLATASAAAPHTVAVMPESLHRTAPNGTEKLGRGGVLAEQVRLILGSDERWSFVERAELSAIEQELALSAAGGLSDAAAIRGGRLSRAQWVLSIRLLATELVRPAVAVEIFDTLRAERLAAVEAPLTSIPDESWLISPTLEKANAVADVARQALVAARARAEELKGRLVIAPLGFINTSRTDRLEPLAAALREALAALESEPGSRLHVLRLDTVSDTFEESLLAQAGLADIKPEEWARFADAFVWVEFSEPRSPPDAPAARALVSLSISAGGDASSAVRVVGGLDKLPDLATRAAKELAAKLEGPTAGSVTPAARAALARRLIDAARVEHPGEQATHAPQEQRRLARAARLIELAAFLAPDNREWRELHLRVARHAAGGKGPGHAYWADRYWEMVDQFIIGADGSVDVGLLQRSESYQVISAKGADRFIRIGQALGASAPPAGANLRSFASRFVHALARASELPRRIEAFEAMWPALRQSLNDPNAHDRTIMESIYRDDRARGRAFLTREFPPGQTAKVVSSPDPWLEFAKPVEPVRPTAAPGPRPQFNRPAPQDRGFHISATRLENNRIVEAPHSSIDDLAQLQTRALEFEPFRVAREPLDYNARLTNVAATPEGLWFIASPNHTLGFGPKARPVFFDLNRHEASTQTLFGELDSAATSLRLAGGRLWLGTQGQGLRVLNRHTREVRAVAASQGLLRDDVLRLEVGRDDAFADPEPGAGAGEFLSRVHFRQETAARATPDASKALDGLPAAVRAAIASFGPGAEPRVKLPAAAGRATWSEPSVAAPDARPFRPLRDPAFATHCRTALGDGYWVGDGSTVAWAAGDQLRPVARFTTARVQALADDGRHLFIAATLREFTNPYGSVPALPPDALRIYVYDHRAGAWRGYFRGVDYFESMSAAPGLLAFTPPDAPIGKRRLLVMNTAVLFSSEQAPAPPSAGRDLLSLIPVATPADIRAALASGAEVNAATATGWTPLMAALWADRPEVVRLLLDAGARVDAVDHRGWHPLLIASAWSSPACLEAILAAGVSPNFQAPAPGPGSPPPHFPRIAAIHAALRSDRTDSVASLVRAGADPDLADDSGVTPRSVAAPAGIAALPARQIDRAQASRQLSQVTISYPESAYVDAVKPLLAAGADPLWLPPSPGRPAIRYAIDHNFFAAAELMLDHIDDLDRASAITRGSSDSRTLGMELLFRALERDRADFAVRLLDKGLLSTAADHIREHGQDPALLRAAIEKGNARIVRALLAKGFRFSSIVNDVHAAAVHVIKRKDAELLAALLEPAPLKNGRHAIPISSALTTRSELNVLFAAIDADWEEGVSLLVRAGAERHAHNSLGQTLVQLVRAKPALAVAFNNRPGSADNTLEGARAMHTVADLGTTLAAAELTPAVLAYREHGGETLLMAAARRGDGVLVRRLLAAGADPRAVTAQGGTALSLGLLACDAATIAALIDAGASPDGAPDANSSPLHIAAFADDAERVAQLLAAGASPTRRSPRDGRQPIHSAASSTQGMKALRALLAARRVDLHATTHAGLGVLEMAVVSDSPEKIQYLLDQGARWQKTQDSDYHPMDVAASRGLTASVRKLAALGLHSPRALSLAKDDATRAILLSDESREARIARDNEALWPDILRDKDNWRARADAFLADGGDVNHRSARWGQPLDVAMRRDDVAQVKYLMDRGANPLREQASFSTSNAKTVFYPWLNNLHNRDFFDGANPRRDRAEVEAERDAIALALLEMFWAHENHEDTRAHLLRAAVEARVPKTAARLVELGASPRFARMSFERSPPQDRALWAKILGIAQP